MRKAEKKEKITEYTCADIASMITSTVEGKMEMVLAMAACGARMEEEAVKLMHDSLIEDNEPLGAAWLLADGQHMTLVIGDLGYRAALYDCSFRFVTSVDVLCMSRNFSGEALADDAAERLGANRKGAGRIDYRTLVRAMAAVQAADIEDVFAAAGMQTQVSA